VAFLLHAIYYSAKPAAMADGALAALLRAMAKVPGQVDLLSTHQEHKRLSGTKLLKEGKQP